MALIYEKPEARNPLNLFRLDGRTALVTGGARGLGAVMAEALSFAGANVALTSRTIRDAQDNASAISDTTGGNTLGLEMEATDAKSVTSTVPAVVKRFGGLDILVNNAGINLRGAIGDLQQDDFEQSLAVNVTGPWLLCRVAAESLRNSGHGRVINVASTLGLVAAADRTPYTASKGAIIQLTRALAVEWAPWNVTVNAIAPGPFLTEMNLQFQHSEHTARVINQEVALQRWGELHEIAGATLYLASDASSYVTGSVLTVDGGWTAH